MKSIKLALLVGTLALPATASAQFRFYRSYDNCNQCQPVYPSQPGHPVAPGQPAYPGQTLPPMTVTPSPKGTPEAKKGDVDGKRDEQPPPEQPQQQPFDAAQQQQQQAMNSPDLSGGDSLTAYNVGMQGRGDANNRFNLFDNMSAIPQSRVWAGYQYLNRFNTGAQASGPSSHDYGAFASRERQLNLYRVGFEYALSPQLSIVGQTQYIASAGVVEKNDSWANPQFAIKYVMSQSYNSVTSAVLGFQPECGTTTRALKETETRFYPGVLHYQSCGPRTFVQAGAQFGLNTGNLANTFDYAVSVGYWLYKDSCMFYNGNCGQCCRPGCRLIGVIPQLEFLGKEVLDNASNPPYAGLASDTIYREDRHVYDMTLGVRFLFSQGLGIAVGGSVPLTGGQVRDAEFLSTVSWNF